MKGGVRVRYGYGGCFEIRCVGGLKLRRYRNWGYVGLREVLGLCRGLVFRVRGRVGY